MKITGTESVRSTKPITRNYEFDIRENEHRKIFVLHGGPTGYESFVIDDNIIDRMSCNGWVANVGSGLYNELRFTADQMKAAFNQLDETPELPTKAEIDAEIEIAKRNDKRASVLCPLRNAMCRIDCESYCQPRVDILPGLGDSPDDHYVTGGYCTASALHTHPV